MAFGELEEALAIEPIRRVSVFDRLLEEPATRSELQEDLDVSRATLHRIATFLTDNGLAVEGDQGLDLTGAGHVVGTAAVDYVASVRTATELDALLNVMDVDHLPVDLDLDVLRDASVVRPQPAQPALPAQRVIEIADASDRLRGVSPVVLPSYVEVFYRNVLDGVETELILSRQAVEALEESYPAQLSEGIRTEQLDLLVADAVPFGLLLTPSRSAIAVYDEEGVLRLLVESDSEAFDAWVRDVYAEYRSASEPYSASNET